MSAMTINRLRERVMIQYPVATNDGQGGQLIVWSKLADVFAEVQPTANYTTQRNLADQLSARAGYRVTIRYRADVNATMQIVWKTHILKISTLQETGDLLEIQTYEELL